MVRVGAIHLRNDTRPKAGLVYSDFIGCIVGFGVGIKAVGCQTFYVHQLNKIMEQINVPIKGEADASELRRVIYAMAAQNPGSFVTPKEIKSVLDLLPAAIGYWLKNSPPLENDDYRGEMHDGIIVRAVPREGHSGVAFGRPYETEDHFDLYVKFEGAALEAISQQLGWEVKNG